MPYDFLYKLQGNSYLLLVDDGEQLTYPMSFGHSAEIAKSVMPLPSESPRCRVVPDYHRSDFLAKKNRVDLDRVLSPGQFNLSRCMFTA
jgi:hypothetical protein